MLQIFLHRKITYQHSDNKEKYIQKNNRKKTKTNLLFSTHLMSVSIFYHFPHPSHVSGDLLKHLAAYSDIKLIKLFPAQNQCNIHNNSHIQINLAKVCWCKYCYLWFQAMECTRRVNMHWLQSLNAYDKKCPTLKWASE